MTEVKFEYPADLENISKVTRIKALLDNMLYMNQKNHPERNFESRLEIQNNVVAIKISIW